GSGMKDLFQLLVRGIGQLRFETDNANLRPRQAGASFGERRLAGNHDLGVPDFLRCLLGVTAVRIEGGLGSPLLCANDQHACAAGEAAQIVDIRQMGNQERIHSTGAKRGTKLRLSASVVHRGKLKRFPKKTPPAGTGGVSTMLLSLDDLRGDK